MNIFSLEIFRMILNELNFKFLLDNQANSYIVT